MNHRFKITLLFFTFVFWMNQIVHSETYDIGKKFCAYFPGQPFFIEEGGSGKNQLRIYRYSDSTSGLLYTSIQHVGELRYRAADLPTAINNYITGQSISFNGRLISSELKTINGKSGAVFVLKYTLNGQKMTKYCAVIYSNPHFYTWSVDSVGDQSMRNAQYIFQSNLKLFDVYK